MLLNKLYRLILENKTLVNRIMLTVHPQYIKDADGNKSLVILPASEFEKLIEELEDIEDVRLYDEAKKHDTGERIPMSEVFETIEAKRTSNS